MKCAFSRAGCGHVHTAVTSSNVYLSVLRLLSKALGLAALAKPFRGARFELC